MHLHHREYGSGPPLIILHGLFGSLDNWAYISGQLAGQFRVFALDQRNHGLSPHSEEMSYEVMAGDLRDFVAERSIPRAHLLGHSMGGKTAMLFALRFPDLVDRLIVVDMAPRAYAAVHDGIFDALTAIDLSAVQTRAQAEEILANDIPDLSVRRFLLKSLAPDGHAGFRWKFNLPVLRKNYPRLNEALPASPPFPGPTLFVRGENSDYIRDEDQAEIRRLFPSAGVVSIPDAGHWLHAEAPDIFLSTALNFLVRGAVTEEGSA